MMKIALAHKRLEFRGGTERVLYRTAEGLRDRGHEIHLFCQQFRIPPPPGVWTHRVPGFARPRSLRALTFAVMAPRIIAKYDCDVAMSFDRTLTQDIFRSGGGPRKMLVAKMKAEGGCFRKLRYTFGLYNHLAAWIERLQLRGNRSGKIIVISEQTKREFMELYDLTQEQILIIPNGVDTVRFHPERRLTQGRKLREDLRIPSDARVVLFVGTGFRRKGLHRLLRLWETNELPGVYLLVVGHDARLAQYRRRWSSESKVIFAGRRDNVEDYYACADLLVLPAIQEAFGNVVLEAMASGLPVVTTAQVGAMEVFEDVLREGIFNNTDDPLELKAKILRMIDRTCRPLLARRARQIAEKYTWKLYFDRLEKTLIECRPPSDMLRTGSS